MSETTDTPPPDALMLLAPGCPHCPLVLSALAELLEQGRIGRLEAVNLGAHPQRARELGVRSVPWVRLGPFVLEGLRSPAELRQWAERAGTRAGMRDYFAELFGSGRLQDAIAILRREPQQFEALLDLLADPDTELQARIGLGAVIEEFEGSDVLRAHVPRLLTLLASEDARIRGDAAHYLALAGDPAAAEALRPLLQDPDPQVREIAAESLSTLAAAGAAHPQGPRARS